MTRFELFLPEKRPFFLAGAELFKQRIRTFYSRRISDITAGGRVLGKSGPLTFSFLGTHAPPVGAEEFKRFEKDFRNRRTTLTLGYYTRAFESVQVSYRSGKNFDADFQLWIAGAAYKITPELSVSYSLQRLIQDSDPNQASTWIHVVRIDQFFTPDLFFRLFFQTNSSIDRRNVQARFVYRYKPPFGTIQVAYQRGTAEFGQASDQGNTLFLKLTGVF